MAVWVDAVLYFFLFGFCGWVCESVFCSILQRKPVNRGFLSSPICPVYGFGGLIVIYILGPFRNNLFYLFLAGMIATTLLEYVTSYILEKLFHASWWDYSHLRFNINGRVCLQFSLIFGALSVVAQRLLSPFFEYLVGHIAVAVKPWLALGFLAIFTADLVVTVHAILKLNGKLEEIKQISAELFSRLEQYHENSPTLAQRLEQYRIDRGEKAESIRESVEAFVQKLEGLRHSQNRFQQRRLFQAFPNMKSQKYREQMQELRTFIEGLKEKRKKK